MQWRGRPSTPSLFFTTIMILRRIGFLIFISIVFLGACIPKHDADVSTDTPPPVVILPTLEAFTPAPTATITPTIQPTQTPRPTQTASNTVAPRPTFPTLTATIAVTDAQAQVKSDRGGLRLRRLPNSDSTILLNLPALTPLQIQARTSNSEWVLVKIPEGFTGWVWVAYIDLFIDLNTIPSVENPEPEPIFAVSPPPDAPVVAAAVTGGARNIYVKGQQLGNRRNIFTTVGDSITNTPNFLHHFAFGYNLRDYGYLLPALQFFSADTARNSNSFDNDSRASRAYWTTFDVLNPELRDAAICLPDETPIECEYRVVRPAISLILIGTNDIRDGTPAATYEANLRRIIEISINMGVIPVVSTLPPRIDTNDQVAAYNQVIRRLSQSYDIPLWDFWGALQSLPNQGISEDGVHPSIPSGAPAATVDFTAENLQYGTTLRNLMALQILDELWRNVMY